jgi:hypothetical protein
MTEYSRQAKGDFISTGASQVINLPFQPDYVTFTNYTASAAFTDHRVLSAVWDVNMGQGFAITNVKNTTYQTDSVILNGISSFSAGTLLQYGATQQVVSSTKADPASFEVTAHGYQSGDVVIFSGLYSTQYTAGMPQMNGIPFTINRTDANNFTVPWNSNQTQYTALAASPSGATVKKVLYPYLYFPGVSFIRGITTGTTTTIDTTDAHNLVIGQEVAFHIPTVRGYSTGWGTTQLNSLPNDRIPGSPIYGYVVSVTDYNTVIVNINSTGYTAYSSNIPVANVPGLSYPMMVAVGDVNTGGVQISNGSALYPPPQYLPFSTTPKFNTINGPAIQGAYVNNTSQGFIIGAGTCVTDTAAVLVGAASDHIYWRAFLHDMSIPI